MHPYEPFMRLAIEEARESLREGNKGFGAVIVVHGDVVAASHDLEVTACDPTAHAEMEAIRRASPVLRLNGGVLVTTHEPCLMCTGAAIWAGLREICYGFSIAEAAAQGRRRIPVSARELLERAGADVVIHEGVLGAECALLYNRAVLEEVARLRGTTPADLRRHGEALTEKRLRWCDEHPELLPARTADPLKSGYELLLAKLGIDATEAPIVERSERRLVFHSRNLCPTLEACRILDLDTRMVCREMTESPAAALIARVHPGLRFSRNYRRLRPHDDVCEEIISLEE
jgi:tRNA(adenine34) deaminase